MDTPAPPPHPTEAELYDVRERARIVQAARTLYLRAGIAQTTAADLARYLRMPEHAVWRWFPTPEPLVEAVVEAHVAAVRAELGSYPERFSTAVEGLLALRNWVSEELQASSGPFFQQLDACYPEARQRWHAHLTSFPAEHLRANLHQGIRQGLYHPGLDVEQQVAAWFAQLEALRHATHTGPAAADLHHAQLTAFLAQLVTPAGALVARRLQEAEPYY